MDQSVPGGEAPVTPQPAPTAGGMPAPGPTGNDPTPQLAAAEPRPARGPARDEWGFDTAFSPSASAELEGYRSSNPPPPICMWCNTALPSRDATKCPTCGALLEPPEGSADVPGLTSMPGRPASFQSAPAAPSGGPGEGLTGRLLPRSQAPAVPGRPAPDPSTYEGLTSEEIALLADSSVALREEISKLGSHDAFLPPSRDVRQAMLEIEFEADRADPMRIVDPGPLAERRREEPPV